MFGYPDETLSVLFDILLKQQANLKIPSISAAKISERGKDPPTVSTSAMSRPEHYFTVDPFLFRNS